MTPMTKRLLLLDSASLYFRAFYGVPERSSPSGLPTNAVRGFLDMLALLVERSQPSHLVACWDNDWRPSFRVAAIPSYKSHRVADASGAEEVPEALEAQVPLIIDALAAIGFARLGSDGYEADDVIGTLATRHKEAMAVDVVTGDRDLFQLVDDTTGPVRVVYTAKGGVRTPDFVDQAYLREKYGVDDGPAYADMAVLRGDASDGLPGVTGIGEKTAAKLISSYGSLEGLRAALAGGDPAIKGAQRARLESSAAYLDAAPAVVAVAKDAPLADIDLAVPDGIGDAALMSRLATEHGLASSFARVLAALGITLS
jgi:5'-3' exonuclease